MNQPVVPLRFLAGEFLADELDVRGISHQEFAQELQLPTRIVTDLINGNQDVTPEVAQRIGAALGTSAELWMNLQRSYEEHTEN